MNSLNILVIGGTGMLAGVVFGLLKEGHQVTVVARDSKRFAPLQTAGATCLSADYLSPSFHSQWLLSNRFDASIAWVHGDAHHVHRAAMSMTDRYIHIVGSSAADPAGSPVVHSGISDSTLEYQKVVLGFMVVNGLSRWLTHAEIVEGVLGAWLSGDSDTVVGQIEPWEMRP